MISRSQQSLSSFFFPSLVLLLILMLSGCGQSSDSSSTPSTDPQTQDADNNDPGTTNPGTTDPGTTNPGTTNPGTSDPGTSDPGTSDPGTSDPGTSDPGTTNPGTSDPGTSDPGTSDPGTSDPGTSDPGTSDPGTSDPGTNPGVDLQERVDNPYVGAGRYHDPEWSTLASSSAARAPADLRSAIAEVAQQPTAVWLDRIAAIDGTTNIMGLAEHLDEAVRQQAGTGKPMVFEVVVYDLPDRDCAARASNGELKIDQNGMQRYKSEYIDRIVQVLQSKAAYRNLRIVAVVEPDSLPNLVTNMDLQSCSKAAPAYKEGVAYAIEKLATVKNVYTYLDIAHSGWLGWEHGDKAAQLYKEVMTSAGGESLVQGFATNVANYSALEEPFNPFDDQNSYMDLIVNWYEWNRVIDEKTYVNGMRGRFPNHHFLIDTGRNGWKAQPAGVPIEARTHRGNWCNIKNAGIGERPRVAPMAGVDAYVWIKPPGASDGTSDASQTTPDEEGKRFDPMCGQDPVVREKGQAITTDALSGAPAAGKWFDEHFFMLVRNATPVLNGSSITDPGTSDPGTSDPGTSDPGTSDPGTSDPGTSDPGTSDPGTSDPGTSDPGTSDPGTNPGVDLQERVDNPYVGAGRYHDPEWSTLASSSAARAPADLRSAIAKVAQQPTAVWLDRIAAIDGTTNIMGLAEHLDEAVRQQAGTGKPMVFEVVVYDLPDRDCAARASNGELKIDQNGMQRYKSEYIDRIVQVLQSKAAYRNLRIVAVVEPDSLPNLVTNMDLQSCSKAAPAYKEGVAYAIEKLATVKNVYTYLDIAHSGWLGWEHGDKAAQLYKEVMTSAGGESLVQGFATNVANYSALEEPFNPFDDQNSYMDLIVNWYEWNRVIDEKTYVNGMRGRFPNHHFLIDTGRNGWKAQPAGVPIEARTHRGNWCNIKNAGIGERPRVAPMAGVDAYVWIKPPGASDGTSDASQTMPDAEGKRFDPMCGQDPVVREKGQAITTDALSGAPAAGKWFDEHFFMLVRNATPALN